MLSIDFRNAVNNSADNFTCRLFQLMLKADDENTAKLQSVYTVEAEMVHMYRHENLKLKDGEVDFRWLEEAAIESVSANYQWGLWPGLVKKRDDIISWHNND